MVNNIQLFIFLRISLVFLEFMVAETMFIFVMPKKKYFILRFIGSIVISIGIIFLISWVNFKIYLMCNFDRIALYIINPIINFLMFILTICIYAFSFNLKIKELSSILIFGYACRYITFCLYSLIFTNLMPQLLFLRMGQVNLLNGFLYLLTYAVIYVGFYFALIRKEYRKRILAIDTKVLVVFSIAIILNTIVGSIGEAISTDLESMLIYNVILISEFLTLTLIITLNEFNQKSNELKLENQLSKMMLENQEKQFKFSKANSELLHIKAHDLKHQIAALRKGGEEAEKVLSDLEGTIQNYESVIITENTVLNVILSEKWMYCTKHNIKFSCTVNPKALKNVETSKLYSLIGNILDNSIEAVTKIKDKNKRIISMNIKYEYGVSVITTKNYFDGEIIFKNGLPESSKGDKENHGYGVKSIKQIVESLGGQCAFLNEENQFIFQATIPD